MGLLTIYADYVDKTTKLCTSYLKQILPQISPNDWWQTRVIDKLDDEQKKHAGSTIESLDLAKLLTVFTSNIKEIDNIKNIDPLTKEAVFGMKIFRRHFAHLSNERPSPEDICRDFDNLWRFMKLIGADEKIIQEIKDLNKQGFACDYYDIELDRILNLLRTKTQSKKKQDKKPETDTQQGAGKQSDSKVNDNKKEKKEPLKYKISFNYKPIGPFPLEEILRKIQFHEVTREWYICPPSHPEKSQWPKIDAIGNQEINKALAEAEKKFKTTNKKPDNQHPKKEETGKTKSENYKVGGFGPAGGIIIYDKGRYSKGWRYLEVAPQEAEFAAKWGEKKTYISNDSNDRNYSKLVGSGMNNTHIIMEKLKKNNQLNNDFAANRCVNLNFNGFNDWFLPSYDELKLMYNKLKDKGLGGFRNSIYWSSTEVSSKNALTVNFIMGRGSNNGRSKNNSYSIRPLRMF